MTDTEEQAAELAEAVSSAADRDGRTAVSGAGGPDPQDDQPPGTVWVGMVDAGETTSWMCRFEGDPPDVLRSTRLEVLTALRDHLG